MPGATPRYTPEFKAEAVRLVSSATGKPASPFSGAARVGPEAFELVLERFETSKLSEL